MNNDKLTNRQLIQLIQNHLRHVEERLGRVEWLQWSLMLAYVAGFLLILVKVLVGG